MQTTQKLFPWNLLATGIHHSITFFSFSYKMLHTKKKIINFFKTIKSRFQRYESIKLFYSIKWNQWYKFIICRIINSSKRMNAWLTYAKEINQIGTGKKLSATVLFILKPDLSTKFEQIENISYLPHFCNYTTTKLQPIVRVHSRCWITFIKVFKIYQQYASHCLTRLWRK